jgi:hypothetical protein
VRHSALAESLPEHPTRERTADGDPTRRSGSNKRGASTAREGNMWTASSVLRWSLSTVVLGSGACAFSPVDSAGISDTSDGGCTGATCPGGDAGGGEVTDADTQPSDVTTVNDPPDTGKKQNADSGGNQGADSGGWINMTNAPTACDERPGAACGWSATNNGVGDTCACRHGDWADGWTCDSTSAALTPGASCPGIPADAGGVLDAAVFDAHGPGSDAGAGGDAGGWVNMTNNPTGCDNMPGTPCGWSATNGGAGYTCACREGGWADGWTCELTGSPVVAGPSCP